MNQTPAVTILLRLEALALGLLCVWVYATFHQSWWLFAALILAPDLSMLGYLGGPRIGAAVYNAVHNWATVIVLFFLIWYVFAGDNLLLSLTFILGAHIGFDRALGYGLKLPSGFKDTHLGPLGRS